MKKHKGHKFFYRHAFGRARGGEMTILEASEALHQALRDFIGVLLCEARLHDWSRWLPRIPGDRLDERLCWRCSARQKRSRRD